MKQVKNIIILGTVGNCIDILDAINEINNTCSKRKYQCIGFLDDDEKKHGKIIHGVRVLGPLKDAVLYKDSYFVNGIGNEHNFLWKDEIIAKTKVKISKFETIIHPSARVSKMSSIGKGTVIFQNVTVGSNVKIGNHVIILPNAVISHDSIIGDYTCITAGVCVSGNVKIGKKCYLGTNCAIINNTTVGDYCLIGMGSVVLNDVKENSVIAGIPARFLRNLR